MLEQMPNIINQNKILYELDSWLIQIIIIQIKL